MDARRNSRWKNPPGIHPSKRIATALTRSKSTGPSPGTQERPSKRATDGECLLTTIKHKTRHFISRIICGSARLPVLATDLFAATSRIHRLRDAQRTPLRRMNQREFANERARVSLRKMRLQHRMEIAENFHAVMRSHRACSICVRPDFHSRIEPRAADFNSRRRQ